VARDKAGSRLGELGFQHLETGLFRGSLVAPSAKNGADVVVEVDVKLPEGFPSALPEVFVADGQLPPVFAHRERSGKICVSSAGSESLDIRQPSALVDEVLARAAVIIRGGLVGSTAEDLAREFLAYWEPGKPSFAWSICDTQGPSRTLFAGFLTSPADRMVLADSREQALQWTGRLGWRIDKSTADAFLLRVDSLVAPPGFNEALALDDWLSRLRAKASESDWAALQSWLGSVSLPALLAVSLPAPGSEVRSLIGVHLPRLKPEDNKAASRGFRPGRVTAQRQMKFAKKYPLERNVPVRLDTTYLTERGGGAPLQAKKVVVVGCGSIGGFLAFNLASLGIGSLILVDPDELGPENVHRHLLGVAELGTNKAAAIASRLGRHYPHQSVQFRDKRIEEVLDLEPDLLLTADLVVLALGNEGLERRLNGALGERVRRLHAWLEPLGVGGHVLLTGPCGGPGCYECLFPNSAWNEAALCAPGQELARSLAGCAGVHSPFSSLDALRTATEAGRLALSALIGPEPGNVLLTWRGEVGEFERLGYQLSVRGRRLTPGTTSRQSHFAWLGCPICGSWRP